MASALKKQYFSNPAHLISSTFSPASLNFIAKPQDMIQKLHNIDSDLDRMLSKQPAILQLERQSGLKKTHLVYGLVGLLVFFLLYRLAPDFVLSLVLFTYPLILSLKAVEAHDKTKDAHILAYWSVVASIQLSEVLLPFVSAHIPFYRLLKLVLAVWMFLPQTKGSLIIYNLAFKPLLHQTSSAAAGFQPRPRAAVPVKPKTEDETKTAE